MAMGILDGTMDHNTKDSLNRVTHTDMVKSLTKPKTITIKASSNMAQPTAKAYKNPTSKHTKDNSSRAKDADSESYQQNYNRVAKPTIKANSSTDCLLAQAGIPTKEKKSKAFGFREK